MTYETDKIEIENIKKLIDCVSFELEVQRRTPTSINIYDLCGIKHYETTHSAILAGLLRWKGNRKALECFIHHFSNIQLSDQELNSASVETEKSININGEQRRLDILIRINNRLLIIIENKINTTDHSLQLQAYSDWLNSQHSYEEKHLIYLTLDGSQSTEGCPEDKYQCLSYKNDIIQWLKDCSSSTQFDMRYHLALFQYQEFWEKWFMETNELNEKIIPQIIENTTSYNSAKLIAKQIFRVARIHLISSILQKWQKTKQEYVSKTENMSDGKEARILFKINDYYDLCFEFNGDFLGLYYGVRLKKLPIFDFNIRIKDGWESSQFWLAYKYIKDDKVRDLGANEDLCIDSPEHIFSILDSAFDELKELIKNELKNYPEEIEKIPKHIDDLRNYLNNKNIIEPFQNIEVKNDGSTYLKGAKLGNDTFGISFLPRLTGYKIIIWENNNFDPQIIANALNTYSKLGEIFPNIYNGDDHYWEHPDIIPFNSIIDWLNGLLNLLKSMQ